MNDERRAADHGDVEVAGDAQRVVGDDVDLLGAVGDAGDAADEAEDDQRQQGARRSRGPTRAPSSATRSGP